MGRKTIKPSKIKAIHYICDGKDDVYYLDSTGRHVNRDIEKIDKPRPIKFRFNWDLSRAFNYPSNITVIPNNPLPSIEVNNNYNNINNRIQIEKHEEKKEQEESICQDDEFKYFPSASMMWLNNPEFTPSSLK